MAQTTLLTRKTPQKTPYKLVFRRKYGKNRKKTARIFWNKTGFRGNFAPKKFTGKELDPETGFYYYGAELMHPAEGCPDRKGDCARRTTMVAVPGKGGAALAAPVRRGARYLDPRTSRWISGDPAIGEYIPGAPVNDEVKKQNQNLPGGAGIFNLVNLHVYHYAGNNPVKYTDPDGRLSEDEETANAAKSLGEKGPKPLPANLENILKDNDWTIVKGDERKSANDSVKEKADQDNLDWSVSSSKEDTPLTEEEELSIADEFKNAIDKWSRANNKPVRREPQKPLTKTTIFEGRIFNIRTRDSGTDKTDIIMRQYIDVNGDDNIDGVRVPKR